MATIGATHGLTPLVPPAMRRRALEGAGQARALIEELRAAGFSSSLVAAAVLTLDAAADGYERMAADETYVIVPLAGKSGDR